MANNGVFDLPRQSTTSLDDAPTGRLEIIADDGTGKLASVDENGLVTKYGLLTVPQDHVFYVGKHGNDSNSGRNLGDAVLTFGQAITLVNAQSPSPSNGWLIQCLDGGIYSESFTIPSYCTIQAQGAVIIGNVVCEGSAALFCLMLQVTSGVAFEKKNDDNTGLLKAMIVQGLGAGIGGIECSQGELVLDVPAIQVTTGTGILNSGSTSSIHGTVGKIGLDGAGIGLKSTGADGEMSLYISEILGATATGIDLDDGHMHLHVGELNVATGGDVATGAKLTAFFADLYGNTFTGAGTINITEAGVSPGGQTDTVAGSNGITNTGDNVDAILTPTYGSAANTFCQGNDARLSDARTPIAHASSHEDGGSDELEITDLATSETTAAKILQPDGAGGVQWNDSSILSVIRVFDWQSFELPNTADWPVNARAAPAKDNVSNAIRGLRFDGTAQEGVGFWLSVPTGFTNLQFKVHGKAWSSPGGTDGVSLKFRFREMPDNGAMGSWAAAETMNVIQIPNNIYFHTDVYSQTLTNWGLTAGKLYLVEMYRDPTDAYDTLDGIDWFMPWMEAEFS